MIKVASWNICGLPYFINQHRIMNDEYRKKIINKLCLFRHVDIICLQEVFDKCLLKHIKDELSNNYEIVSIRKKGICLFCSGLVILVKKDIKIITKSFINFKICCGEDCFANKGFLHLSLLKDNISINVINTHLNNDQPLYSKLKSTNVSKQQILSLKDYIKPFINKNIIICGDFNRSSNFIQQYLTELKGFTTSQTYQVKKEGESPNIDHILSKTNNDQPTIHNLNDVSDHSLILKEIELRKFYSFNMCDKKSKRKSVKRKKSLKKIKKKSKGRKSLKKKKRKRSVKKKKTKKKKSLKKKKSKKSKKSRKTN